MKIFFDFTNNSIAYQKLCVLLQTPLNSFAAIAQRQLILKACIKNIKKGAVIYYFNDELMDAFQFMNAISNIHTLRLKLYFPEREIRTLKSKILNTVILLNKIRRFLETFHTEYFEEEYQAELNEIKNFLQPLNTEYYAKLIADSRFKNEDYSTFYQKILTKKANRQTAVFWEQYFRFEVYLSLSKGIIKHNFTFPKVGSEQFILEEFYHPGLNNPVKNTIEIHKNTILLTGANMSGKSTLLKSM